MSEEQSLRKKWRSCEAAEELVKEFEASGLRLVLSGGLRVDVSKGFDGETLKRLLAVIEQR